MRIGTTGCVQSHPLYSTDAFRVDVDLLKSSLHLDFRRGWMPYTHSHSLRNGKRKVIGGSSVAKKSVVSFD